MEAENSTVMSVARPSSRGAGATVDFKATLMVQELKDLVTGSSETKWFG